MRLIIYLIIFTLISSKVYANFNLNGAPLAENRINLTPQDFKISIESQKKMKVNIDPNSIHWVRYNKNLLIPRIKIDLFIESNKSDSIFVEYKKEIFHLEKNGRQFSSELFYSPFENSPLNIYNDKKVIGKVQISMNKKYNHLIDYTCSRNNIKVDGLENYFISLGCNTKRIGEFGKEKPLLTVNWITPNLIIKNTDINHGTAVFTKGAPIEISAIDKRTNKLVNFRITSRIPKRLHRLFTAYGFGPYALETASNKDDQFEDYYSPAAPALFFYTNYKISEETSIRGFNALVFDKSVFNNAGAYLGSDFGFSLDNKLYFTTLLGVQHLFFKFDNDTTEVSEFIVPQGIEFMYRHAFDIPNYIISGGGFLSPSESFDYQNIWIRWGKNYFWELNYIYWANDNLSAKMWGLSVGFPFKGFL